MPIKLKDLEKLSEAERNKQLSALGWSVSSRSAEEAEVLLSEKLRKFENKFQMSSKEMAKRFSCKDREEDKALHEWWVAYQHHLLVGERLGLKHF